MGDESTELAEGATLRTRASLIARIRNWNDNSSWKEFHRLYYAFVFRYAHRSGLTHHEAEEATQDVFEAVAKKVEGLKVMPRPGSFRKWLGTQATWRVTDKLRERKKPSSPHHYFSDAKNHEKLLENLPEPNAEESERLETEWRKELYEEALTRLALRANPKHYQVFQLHYRDEWPLKKIAKELGISRTSAYVINHRLKAQLKEELESLESQL